MRGKSGTKSGYRPDLFLDFVCARHHMDRAVVSYAWWAIKESMLYWFKNEQKPVDMESFSIHPMPYRANWKEIMLAKHPNAYMHFLKPKEQWREALSGSGFINDLGSTDLIAMEWPGIVVWGMEVQMHNPIMDEFFDGELKRRQASHPAEYVKYYEGCVSRRLDDILQIYNSWLRQIEAPMGAMFEGNKDSDPGFMPRPKRGRLYPRWKLTYKINGEPVGPSGNAVDFIRERRKRMRKSLWGKAKKMRVLSNLPAPAEDLRGLPDQPDLDGPGHPGNGDGGVRMLYSVQGEAQAGGLLAEGEGVK